MTDNAPVTNDAIQNLALAGVILLLAGALALAILKSRRR